MPDLEPAQHDMPDGPEKGWSAKDFDYSDWVNDEKMMATTEHVADGEQVD